MIGLIIKLNGELTNNKDCRLINKVFPKQKTFTQNFMLKIRYEIELIIKYSGMKTKTYK
jgi:hypothetical protein